MVTIIWSKTLDFFLAILLRSKIGAKAIIDALDANLLNANADPEIMALYVIFHPLCVDFDAKYLIWNSLRSSNPSTTLSVKKLLAELSSTHIRLWDNNIQDIYDINSIEYKALLPHRRTPFQEGTIALRIEAIANLLVAMGTDASLASIKTEVLAFQTLLLAAKTKSATKVTSIGTAGKNVIAAIKKASPGMMCAYGGLVKKFYLSLATVDNFFTVALLLKVTQTDFTATLKSLNPKKLFKRKLDSLNELVGTNLSANIVLVYFTNGLTKILAPGDLFISMPATTIATYTLAQAGYSDTKRCLFVKNTAAGDASIEIDIV